jgi:hypothetical protein
VKRWTFVVAASAATLVAGFLVSTTVQAATLRVPKTTWPVCSAARVTYCVESVTVTPPGGQAVALQYVASGAALESAPAPSASPSPSESASPSPSPSESASPSPSPSAPAVEEPSVITVAGRALAGRWTLPDWQERGLHVLGYDGLFVDAKTANEFVNHVMVDVNPAKVAADNKVFLAAQSDNKSYATSLDPDVEIAVKVRTGEIKTGVTVAVGLDVTVDAATDSNGSTLTFTGTPVTVPLAKSARDCSGETGVAAATVRQFQAIIVVQNDTSGFGVDGVSGDMYVGTNGVCSLSTPVWNSDTQEFSWQVGAPHFAPDGTTVNRGFYKAIIPAADAKLLWGLENANDAATALQVSVQTEAGGSQAALSNVSVRNGRIIIDVSNFTYSRPTLKIKKNPAYQPKKVAQVQKPKAKTTITCVKGKTVRKVTAVNPKCPAGFKKK